MISRYNLNFFKNVFLQKREVTKESNNNKGYNRGYSQTLHGIGGMCLDSKESSIEDIYNVFRLGHMRD